MPVLALLGAVLTSAVPQTSEEVHRKVSALLAEQMPKAEARTLDEFARRIGDVLGKASHPLRLQQLLSDLPPAVEYHVDIVKREEERPEAAKANLGELLNQGYSLEIDYLAARISRAAQVSTSQDDRRLIREQSAALIAGAQEALRSRLPGAPAAAYLERNLSLLSKEWMASLDLPLHCSLDRPLTPDELRRSMEAISKAAESFAPIVVTEGDFLDDERLGRLGVHKLLNAVVESVYSATQACFSEFKSFEDRERTWKAAVRRELQRSAPLVPAPRARDDSDPPGILPSHKAVAKPKSIAPTPRPAVDVEAPPSGARRDPPEEREGFPLGPILCGAAILGILLWMVARKRSSAA